MSDTEKIFDLTNDFLFKAVFDQESNNTYDWCGCLELSALGVIDLINYKFKLNCANCLHICHNKYSVWTLALKAIRL